MCKYGFSMSSRYYLFSALIVIALTLIVGVASQRKSLRELFLIFIQVVVVLVALGCIVVGLVKLLIFFGIAEEGFVL